MSKKIFISARLAEEWVAKLYPYGQVDFYDWGKTNRLLEPTELVSRIADADLAIIESDNITAEIIAHAKNLRWIVVCRGTVINVDISAATERGILIANTPGRNADAVADLTVCFMIMISRHVLKAVQSMASGDWVKEGKREIYLRFQGIELYGRTAGLVGLGAIGSRVAERLSAFHMQLLAYDPYVSPSEAQKIGVQLVDLDTLMRQSDFVSLHAPLTEKTRGMIGSHQIGLMKPSAYFINTARAELVDETALINALREHKIAGAAVDVYLEEPLPLGHPWYSLDNVICTPHIGGASKDVVNHQSEMAIKAAIDFLERRIPKHTINNPLKVS